MGASPSERLSQPRLQDQFRPTLSRRQLLTCFPASLLLLPGVTACSSMPGYDLTPRRSTIYDKPLSAHPDRGIQQVVFEYVPDRAVLA